jgi:hypothetical protein
MKRTVLLMLIAVTAATACNRREDAASTPGAAVSPPPAATTEPAPSEPVEPEQAASTPVAPAAEELPAQAEPPPPTGDGCNAEPAQRLVGEVYTADLGEEARVAAGARVERALRPGQIVTMEFRADRLSFTLDEKGRISAVSCG